MYALHKNILPAYACIPALGSWYSPHSAHTRTLIHGSQTHIKPRPGARVSKTTDPGGVKKKSCG